MRLMRGALAGALVIILVPTSASAAKKVKIKGGGWGHGIGMSQYGAYGRAQNGDNATEIVEHYYSNANVSTGEIPQSLRVGLLQGRGSISLTSEPFGNGPGSVIFKVAGSSGKIASGAPGALWRVESSRTGGMRLYRNDRKIKRGGRTVFGSPTRPLVLKYEATDAKIDVTDKPYDYVHGHMEFVTYASGSCPEGYCMSLVVVLSMQKYLYGLGEVPASWPGAALRAQAIAGRTYALDKVQRSGQHRYPCDCAVYDSTIDQAYIGDSKRTGSAQYWDDWKTAVDETRAMVILYSGDPIQALYSSSSGGHTEHNENVWGGTPLPYLRGVPDAPDDNDANPNYTWELEMSWKSFEAKLNAAYGTGTLKSFKIVKPLGVSGRVTVVKDTGGGGVRIVGSKKTVRVSGWSVRSTLGLKDTLFTVNVSYDVGGMFQQRYDQLDGAAGEPTSSVYAVPRRSSSPRGRAQDFSHGRMTWVTETDKVLWQWGEVLAKYDALGREKSVLGMPSTDTWGRSAFRVARYRRGVIVWSESTGAHHVWGAFDGAYVRSGGVKGSLGLPTKRREQTSDLPDEGRRQRFTDGTLYLNPHGDLVFALWGEVDTRYRELGAATSACGYPVADAAENGGSELVAVFANGTISWSEANGVKVDC